MRSRNASWLNNSHGPLAAAATALWCTMATASPEGGTFLHGDGSISSFGGGVVTVVELIGPDRFVVGWNDFDVAAGESVTFNGVDFTVLNTINGGAPSSSWMIDGTINAPGGDVWFVNPAGVMFGETAVLDVGGLLAAAGAISTADFVAGNDLFSLTGDVSFAGTMSTVNGLADRVILLGHHVDNTGLLQGNVIALASGDTIRLIDLGTRITLEIDGTALDGAVAAAGNQASMNGTAMVANHGRIETGQGGQVLLGSGDALGAILGGLAIEHDGEIVSAGGSIELLALDGAIRTDQSWDSGNAFVTNAGLIDASSQSGGGDITLTGPAVVIGSTVRSQGGLDGGGGTVAVRGSGSVVLAGSDVAGWTNAAAGHAGTGSISVVGGNAAHDGGTIQFDAGDGRVVGSGSAALTAQGGLTGGDGGAVDVRGAELQWNTRVRASAVNGNAGSVAYASTNALRITDDGTIGEADFSDLLAAASGDAFIGAQLAQSLGYVDSDMSVASGGRLTVQTSIAGLPGDGPTRLVGDASFSGTDIVLADASGTTELQAGATLSLLGDLIMQDTDAVLLAGQRDGVSGMELGGSVRAVGTYRGSLDLSSPGVVYIEGDIGIAGDEIGSLVFRSVDDLRFIGSSHTILATGDVTLASMDGSALAVSLMGDLAVQADGNVVFGDGLTISGNESLTAIAGGTLENRAVADIAGDLTFVGGTVDNHMAITVGGDLVVDATGGSLQINDVLSAGGSIELGASSSVSVAASILSGGDLTISSDSGGLSIDGTLDANGGIDLTAQGDISATAAISTHGSESDRGVITIATPGSILLTGGLMASGHDVLLDAGASLSATQVQAASLTAVAGGDGALGDVTVSGVATADVDGVLRLTGDVAAADVHMTAARIDQDASSAISQAGGAGIVLDATGDVVLAGTVLAEGSLGVTAGNDLTIGGEATALTIALQAGDTMVLDGATIASLPSGVIGSTSVHLAAPTISVVNDSTVTAADGEMKLVGVDATLDTLAQVNLDGGSLHMEAEQGSLVFVATADGDGDLLLNSSQGMLYVGGDLGSDTALRSISLSGANGLQLGGTMPLEASGQSFAVNALTAEGSIALQAEDLDAIQGGVASIMGFSDSMSITSTTGDIALGANQGFVQLGHLSMQAAGTVAVTDVTALGDLTLNAGTLRVHQRQPVALVDADSSVAISPQASIVAGGDLTVSVGDIDGDGPGQPALFGALGTVTGISDDQEAQPADFQRTDLMLAGPASTTSLLLEWLAATGAGTTSTDPTIIAAESQSTQAMPDLLLEGNDDLVTDAALSEMGIVLRPLDESRGNATRLARPGEVTVDLVSGPGPAQVGRVVVTRTRLLRKQVGLAVEGWRSAWADGAGARALGVPGPVRITANVASGLAAPTALRVPDRAALNRLQLELRAAYRHLILAGLTPSEIDASKQYVINSLVAQGASADAAVAALR